MNKLFKRFKKGLEEALAHTEGKITLKSKVIKTWETPTAYRARGFKRMENIGCCDKCFKPVSVFCY